VHELQRGVHLSYAADADHTPIRAVGPVSDGNLLATTLHGDLLDRRTLLANYGARQLAGDH